MSKRAFSDISEVSNPEPPAELLIRLGKNALSTLNCIHNYSRIWIPMLNLLAANIEPSELFPFLDHGSKSAFSKAMTKASSLIENSLVEHVTPEEVIVKEKEKNEAREFLISHTKENKAHRLITKESVSTLFTEYIESVQEPLEVNAFTDVYHDLRILKDKHCIYSIYSCPKCEDDLPTAESLLKKLKDQEGHEQKEDFKTVSEIYQHLSHHKAKAKVQTNCFESLWANPL